MDLDARRGDDETYDLELTDAAGDPVPLTGAEIVFTARQHMWSSTALITKAVGSGITITDAAAGLATLDLLPADTADLEDGALLDYDVQLTVGGRISTPIVGRLYVRPDVTR